ncbi:MAG: iron donor protein CyaY [Woeseiaceae bacterium]
MSMNESEFNDVVDDIFIEIEDAIEEACDETGADIDYETTSGILTLTFANQTQIIINRQAPLQQIWVAAKAGGFHFDFDSGKEKWICSSVELYVALSEYCTEQAEQTIVLIAP